MDTLARHSRKKLLFINNEWRDAASGKTMDVINPATEEVSPRSPRPSKDDLDAAVAAARAAFNGPWGQMSARERGRLVQQARRASAWSSADEIARLETLHNGKPICESRHIEIPAAAECFEYYGGWADKVMGETIPVKGNYLNYTLREPLGVCRRDRAVELSAAARGLEGRAGARLRQHDDPQAGEPDAADRAGARRDRGRGRPAAGRAQRHHRTRARASGRRSSSIPASTRSRSPATPAPARAIMRGAADTLKKITLELGGKSPNIVLAGRRHRSGDPRRHDRHLLRQGGGLRRRLAAAGRQVDQGRVHRQARGAGEEDGGRRSASIPKTRFGALSSKKQMETVLRYVDIAKKEGATLVAGGERADIGTGKGYFFQPTVFADVTPEMTISREEIFGPVLAGDRVRRPRRGDRPRQRHRPTASPPASGPATSRRRTTSRASSRPAPSGSTPTTSTTRPRRSAATSRAASAAR